MTSALFVNCPFSIKLPLKLYVKNSVDYILWGHFMALCSVPLINVPILSSV